MQGRQKRSDHSDSDSGGVRYGSQIPMFKARSLDDQNYDGRKEC